MCMRLMEKNQALEAEAAATAQAARDSLTPLGTTIIASLDDPGAQVQVFPTALPGCAPALAARLLFVFSSFRTSLEHRWGARAGTGPVEL